MDDIHVKKKPCPLEADVIVTDFGRQVRAERQRRHMTVEQLAEYAGTSNDTVKRIENNRKSSNRNGKAVVKVVPGLDTAYNISRALGIPMQALLPVGHEDMISSIKTTQAFLQRWLDEQEKK